MTTTKRHSSKASRGSALLKQLEARIRELEAAVRRHRRATGHQMCWENDQELWAVLKDAKRFDHTPPPWPEFMRRCALYRASKDRKRGGR